MPTFCAAIHKVDPISSSLLGLALSARCGHRLLHEGLRRNQFHSALVNYPERGWGIGAGGHAVREKRSGGVLQAQAGGRYQTGSQTTWALVTAIVTLDSVSQLLWAAEPERAGLEPLKSVEWGKPGWGGVGNTGVLMGRRVPPSILGERALEGS